MGTMMRSVVGLLLAMVSIGAVYAAAPPPGVGAAETHLLQSGAKIVARWPAAGGLTALVAESGSTRRLFYVTPDGEGLIVGLVFDAQGHNTTTADVAKAGLNQSADAVSKTPAPAEAWRAVQALTPIIQGRSERVIYAFIDPQCPYCHRFIRQIGPMVEQGQVQIRWLPVGILTDESKGLARALYHGDADTAFAELMSGALQSTPPDHEDDLRVARNVLALRQTGKSVVPLFVYRDRDGNVIMQQGLPSDAEMAKMLGGA